MIKRVVIGGGGTGGHVFPAISIANAIREIYPDSEILFVGALGRLEMEKVPEAGYKIIGLPVMGFQRRFTLKNVQFFYKLFESMLMARKIIKEFKPQLAIGVGGYASGPILGAASRKGIPTLIQEQNSYAGVTNKLLAKHASIICVAYEHMDRFFPSEKIVLTGNPVRRDILSIDEKREKGLAHFKLSGEKPVVLIIGGSLGAATINRAIQNELLNLPDGIQFIWQSGRLYYDDAYEACVRSGRKNVVLLPFIKEMDLAYACADIIVSRAGAGTISELAIVGKPVILIPSPNVAEDHQTQNAMALTSKKAAIMVKDVDAEKTLLKTISELSINEILKRTLSTNIKKLAIPDAALRIANEGLKLIKG
jgi:UDP-N-acetylglucosamine--N-acetylmuramyl-(pentapeptide) pyrophosphoryl-undecaprenol N-acetylglucosamine transferase